jgi:hypothetical protein
MGCDITIGVDVTELGNEVNKRIRFSTTDPDAVQVGYGTVLGTTMEAVPLGQCAASLIEAVYIRSVDNTMYVCPASTTSTAPRLKLEAGEACLFRPENSVVLSVGIVCSTAGSNYEFLVTGQSS